MRWKDGLGIIQGRDGQNLRRMGQDAATGGLGCCNKWVRMQGHLCQDAGVHGPGNVRYCRWVRLRGERVRMSRCRNRGVRMRPQVREDAGTEGARCVKNGRGCRDM